MRRIFETFGGRKNFNVYLALVFITTYAAFSNPAFLEFAAAVAGILGIGSFATAWEDRKRGADDVG